ncbi:MAG: hypothetical protein HDR55_04915 [Treponema sp.]|nr:hypothetical protein [Treponema sp.]
MEKRELQKELDDLGIVSIEAAGELSVGLVQNAIGSTKNLLSHLDLGTIAKEADKNERKYLDDISNA